MMQHMSRAVFVVMLGNFFAGCQTSSLYFATDTSVGLVDLSGNSKVPDKLSFGFKRSEILIIPEKDLGKINNKLQPVLGFLNSDVTWFNGSKIEEVYATGAASNCAAYQLAVRSFAEDETLDTRAKITAHLAELGFEEADLCSLTDRKRLSTNKWKVRKNNSLVFEVKTAFSIANLAYGETEAPNITLLSYKRRVGSIIPLFDKDSVVSSVYSDFCFNSKRGDPTKKRRGTSVKQAYATGLAAVMVAKINGIEEADSCDDN